MIRTCFRIWALLCAVLLFPFPAAAHSGGEQADVRIVIEGSELMFAPAPFMKSGYTLVPAGPLFRALGFAVWQDADGRIAIGEKGNLSIVFSEGEPAALFKAHGKEQELPLPVAPISFNRTLHVPLRVLSEIDGRDVQWDAKERRISIARTESAASPQPPVQVPERIRVMSESRLPVPGEEPWTKLLEERAGVSVDWISVPPEHYIDKTNVMIAAGEIPDILYLKRPQGYDPEWFRAFLKDISLELDAYPYLAAEMERHMQGARTPDGFLFGIPRETPAEQLRFPFIRKDWLDKLGLPMPTNEQELLLVMEMFTKADPDGNGKHDTAGVIGAPENSGLGRLSWVERMFTGSVGRFVQREDGGITDTLLEEGAREALMWLNEAYKRNYVHPEFSAMTVETMLQALKEGRAGIAELTLEEAYELNRAFASESSPARLVPLVGLKTAQGGPLLPGNALYTGAWTVSRFVSDARLPAVLSLLDTLYSPESRSALTSDAAAEFAGWSKAPDEWLRGVSHGDSAAFSALVEEWKAAAPHWDLTLPGWLAHEQRAALAAWNETIRDTQMKVILGIEPIAKWDEVVRNIRSDAAYQEAMAGLKR